MAIIGREPPADIVIPAPQVSARHAQILHLQGDRYLLQDLGSSNGTFVNGRRIDREEVGLADRIRLGSFELSLAAYAGRIERTPSSSAPAGPRREELESFRGTPAGGWARGQEQTARASTVPVVEPPAPVVAAPADPVAAQPKRKARPSRREPGLGTDLAVALAAQKTFGGKAFLAWALYYVGFGVIGAIMNMVYLSEANEVKRLTGRSPSGRGCLIILLLTHFLPIIIFIIALIVTGGAVLASLSRMFN